MQSNSYLISVDSSSINISNLNLTNSMIQLIFINRDSIVSILDGRLRNLTQKEEHITLIKRRVPKKNERSLLKLTNNCYLYIERSVIADIEGQVISAN